MGQANTSAIANGVASLLQGVQYQNAALYSLVKVGAVIDPTDVVRYATVTFQARKTQRYDSGWKVNSTPILQIESGVDYSIGGDTTSAEITIMDISDLLTALFVARYALNSVPGVYVTLVDIDDKAAYKVYPGGRIYRVHLCYVKAVQQYNVTLNP